MNGVRFKGGPLDGEVHIAPTAWPLPEMFSLLLHSDEANLGLQLGSYRKVSESQLPDEAAAHPNVLRGAEYEWEVDYNEVPDEATPVEVGEDGKLI